MQRLTSWVSHFLVKIGWRCLSTKKRPTASLRRWRSMTMCSVPLDVALEVALEVALVVAELDPLAVGLEDCEGEADDVRLAWAVRVDELDRDAVRELELEPVDAALRELDALDEPDNEP
jgi:hypothetical protein